MIPPGGDEGKSNCSESPKHQERDPAGLLVLTDILQARLLPLTGPLRVMLGPTIPSSCKGERSGQV